MSPSFSVRIVASIFLIALGTACHTYPPPGTPLNRKGDEIVVAGKLFHTGTRVVLWMDERGYDAYRVERRFAPLDKADWKTSTEENPDLETPNRFGLRRSAITDQEAERVRGGGWDLATLQRTVDQFVIHYDACGTSRQCFKVLHDIRCLSVHFMLDLDGTIYQTLDLKERAWHASIANTRSIGIEIAHIGAFGPRDTNTLNRWYKTGENGRVHIEVPKNLQPSGILTENFQGEPRRQELIRGTIQGRELSQYDFTPEQYEALAKLAATLCTIFPQIECDYPRDQSGELVTRKLPAEQLIRYKGLLGHYHIQTNKIDPGPAFDWDLLVSKTRKYLSKRGHTKRP